MTALVLHLPPLAILLAIGWFCDEIHHAANGDEHGWESSGDQRARERREREASR